MQFLAGMCVQVVPGFSGPDETSSPSSAWTIWRGSGGRANTWRGSLWWWQCSSLLDEPSPGPDPEKRPSTQTRAVPRIKKNHFI